MNHGPTGDSQTMCLSNHVNEGWVWWRHHLRYKAEAAFQPHATEHQASHQPCEQHIPPQDDKVNCTGGRQSVVIEILAEQKLICVIIVCWALAEAKIHSTWCIHCFPPNTDQAPHLQAWLLYNNSSLWKQLKTTTGTMQLCHECYRLERYIIDLFWKRRIYLNLVILGASVLIHKYI